MNEENDNFHVYGRNIKPACDLLRKLLEKEGIKHIEHGLKFLEMSEEDAKTLAECGEKLSSSNAENRDPIVQAIVTIHDKYTESISIDINTEDYNTSYIGKGMSFKKSEYSEKAVLTRLEEHVVPACLRSLNKEGAKHISNISTTMGYNEEKGLHFVRCCIMIWKPKKKE